MNSQVTLRWKNQFQNDISRSYQKEC